MDRLVRARVLLAEAAALGVTIEDLVAESSGCSQIVPALHRPWPSTWTP